ncbi:MAG: nucleotidyltransferase [Symploca sp. SIO2E9]|nr:nucleotidyltransferase [Symploca sp. SIO2E9]
MVIADMLMELLTEHYKYIPKEFYSTVELCFVDSGGYENNNDNDLSTVYATGKSKLEWNESLLIEVYNSLPSDGSFVLVNYDFVGQPILEQMERSVELLSNYQTTLCTMLLKLEQTSQRYIDIQSVLPHIDKLRHFDIVFERLQSRLPTTKIRHGNLAVTVEFKDAEIQLLPAIRHESGFKIADFTGNNWSTIKPREFTNWLTEVNKNNGRKIVPTIKLAKSIIAGLPKSQRLSGYHTESIAVKIFQKYQGLKRTKDMLAYFFDEASRQVLQPIRDITGQSMHVDDHLGSVSSAERQKISKSLDRISRRMKNADCTQSINQWREILD